MNLEFRVRPQLAGDQFTIITEKRDIDDPQMWIELSRDIADLKEKTIRDGLIAMGWTPPESAAQPDVTDEYDRTTYSRALEESVKLQSHYAKLLNDYDGGERRTFKSAEEWMARLKETGRL